MATYISAREGCPKCSAHFSFQLASVTLSKLLNQFVISQLEMVIPTVTHGGVLRDTIMPEKCHCNC